MSQVPLFRKMVPNWWIKMLYIIGKIILCRKQISMLPRLNRSLLVKNMDPFVRGSFSLKLLFMGFGTGKGEILYFRRWQFSSKYVIQPKNSFCSIITVCYVTLLGTNSIFLTSVVFLISLYFTYKLYFYWKVPPAKGCIFFTKRDRFSLGNIDICFLHKIVFPMIYNTFIHQFGTMLTLGSWSSMQMSQYFSFEKTENDLVILI